MKARWLAILCALAVGVPACDSKSKSKDKDKEEEAEKDKDKEKGKDKDKDKAKDKDKDPGASVSGTPSATPPTTAAATPDDGEPIPPPPYTEPPKAPMTKEALAAFLKDDKATMTPEAYESLLLGLVDCGNSVDRYGVDYKCQAKKDLSEASRKKNEDYKKVYAVALKHIRHPNPNVRYEASSYAENAAFGYSAVDDGDKLYINAVRAEKDNVVLAHMLSSLYEGARKSARVRKVIVGLLEHSDARVRENAVKRLSDYDVIKEVDGAYEKLLTRVEKDSDNAVRAEACAGLSHANIDQSIPVYTKLLTDAGTPDEVREGCFEGLIETWVGSTYPKKPSKDGYDLTLKLLEKTDRTDKFPPSRGMSNLMYAKTEYKNYENNGKEWYETAKAFYDKARLVKALEALALDEKAAYGARSSTIYILKNLKEKTVLENLASKIKGQSGMWAKSLSESAEKASKEKMD